MCLYVRDLDGHESRQLSRILKSSRTVTYMRRAQVVAFSGQGARVQEIAARLHLHEEYVRELIRRFNRGSFDALRPRRRSGAGPHRRHARTRRPSDARLPLRDDGLQQRARLTASRSAYLFSSTLIGSVR